MGSGLQRVQTRQYIDVPGVLGRHPSIFEYTASRPASMYYVSSWYYADAAHAVNPPDAKYALPTTIHSMGPSPQSEPTISVGQGSTFTTTRQLAKAEHCNANSIYYTIYIWVIHIPQLAAAAAHNCTQRLEMKRRKK